MARFRSDLDAIPVFDYLPDAGRERLETVARYARFKLGDVVTDEGAAACYFFAIESGTAEASVRGRTVGTLRPGDFFGAIGALPHEEARWGRRSATVTATSRLAVLEVPDHELYDLVDAFPSFGRVLRDAAQLRASADAASG